MGTLELLLIKPISVWNLVLGKFWGAFLLCVIAVVPTIIYVFSTNDSTAVAVMFAVYALVAGSVDNILKPLVLGRGVNAPMPVILLGALGGMASGGIIGLFQGSVMLTLGYQLFMAWVYGKNEEE